LLLLGPDIGDSGSNRLDISDLSDGVYFIKLSFEKQKARSAKFIKSTF
jgi:hypothetical protein